MKRQSLLLLLWSLFAVSAALATTYVRVEKDGTKTYSDRPMPGGQPVDLQPAQTYSAPPSGGSSESQRPREEQMLQQADDFRYESCTVTTPENNTTLQNPESVIIAASTKPALRSDDVITMTVDGQPAGNPNSLSYTMSPVHRGTHTVGLSVANSNGKVVCSSTSVFHVLHPGLNSPGRPAAPRPPRPAPPRPTPH